MTTTARHQTPRIAADTATLADLVAFSGLDCCDVCGLAAVYLYPRTITIDVDGQPVCDAEIRVCERHAADDSLGCYPDCD